MEPVTVGKSSKHSPQVKVWQSMNHTDKTDKKELRHFGIFSHTLCRWYESNGRKDLPWRVALFDSCKSSNKHNEEERAYKVWVSEIMLQQTQVNRVIDYYAQFMDRFDTLSELARVTWEEFLPYYQGLGYYARGKNMLKTAQRVSTKYGGKFPNTVDTLKALPGIGSYTARAIASFAFGQSYLAWDTNFRRVFGRFFAGTKDASLDPTRFEKYLSGTIQDVRVFNGAVMDFGSIVCVRRPRCNECVLKARCQYAKHSGKTEIMAQKNPQATPFHCKTHSTQAIVILHKKSQVFYSQVPLGKLYKPFLLPIGVFSRDAVKEWFLRNYGLTVSVRPPYKRVVARDRILLFVRVQVLLGAINFREFTPKEAGAILKDMEVEKQ